MLISSPLHTNLPLYRGPVNEVIKLADNIITTCSQTDLHMLNGFPFYKCSEIQAEVVIDKSPQPLLHLRHHNTLSHNLIYCWLLQQMA